MCLGLASGLAGCARSRVDAPSATLAATREAERAFAPIHDRWSKASPEGRAALDPSLRAFRDRYPADPLAGLAAAMLGYTALERGDLRGAVLLARPVRVGRPGLIRDFAQVVEAAALRRGNRPREALALLLPLVGKLFDAPARTLHAEEVVLAAVYAGDAERALTLFDLSWKQATADEKPALMARLVQVLPRIPQAALAKALGDPRMTFEDPVLEKLAQRRAEGVIAANDVEGAKLLLKRAGPLLGGRTDDVARLAAGAAAARVEGRTVGLLLPVRDDVVKRRAAEVAAGLAYGLALPGSAARLVTLDDGGDVKRVPAALKALATQGASVIVAGFDAAESALAAQFAAAAKVPVLLLQPPPSSVGSPYVFTLGEPHAAAEDALVAAVQARGARVVLAVQQSPRDAKGAFETVACSALGPAVPAKCPDAVVLAADQACAEEALEQLATRCPRALFAAGLDASVALPARSFVATSGLFPVDAYATDPSLNGWVQQKRSAPSFWAGLGRDAALLAWAGVRDLKDTDDASEVGARRDAVARALATTKVDLWTTKARGFDAQRALPRPIGIREAR